LNFHKNIVKEVKEWAQWGLGYEINGEGLGNITLKLISRIDAPSKWNGKCPSITIQWHVPCAYVHHGDANISCLSFGDSGHDHIEEIPLCHSLKVYKISFKKNHWFFMLEIKARPYYIWPFIKFQWQEILRN
jgi:hypothetical protein